MNNLSPKFLFILFFFFSVLNDTISQPDNNQISANKCQLLCYSSKPLPNIYFSSDNITWKGPYTIPAYYRKLLNLGYCKESNGTVEVCDKYLKIYTTNSITGYVKSSTIKLKGKKRYAIYWDKNEKIWRIKEKI